MDIVPFHQVVVADIVAAPPPDGARRPCLADESHRIGIDKCTLRKYSRWKNGTEVFFWEAKLPEGESDIHGKKSHSKTVIRDNEEAILDECTLWALTAMNPPHEE